VSGFPSPRFTGRALAVCFWVGCSLCAAQVSREVRAAVGETPKVEPALGTMAPPTKAGRGVLAEGEGVDCATARAFFAGDDAPAGEWRVLLRGGSPSWCASSPAGLQCRGACYRSAP
jgi:hypothetical protein